MPNGLQDTRTSTLLLVGGGGALLLGLLALSKSGQVEPPPELPNGIPPPPIPPPEPPPLPGPPTASFAFLSPCPPMGDLDSDGWVTNWDVDLLRAHLSGTIVLSAEQLRRADVTGSGTVNIVDVLRILRVAAGQEISFACPQMQSIAGSFNNIEEA